MTEELWYIERSSWVADRSTFITSQATLATVSYSEAAMMNARRVRGYEEAERTKRC